MNYTKPSLVSVGSAAQIVLNTDGDGDKKGSLMEGSNHTTSTTAYEIDE